MVKFFKNKRNIVLGVSLLLFVVLLFLIKLDIIDYVDNHISSFMINIRSEKLTKTMILLTNIGGAYSLLSISLLLFIYMFIFMKDKKKPLIIFINLVSVFFFNRVLKLIFGRSRPDENFLVAASGYSFPSGHAMVLSAYLLFITYLVLKNSKSKLFKAIFCIFSFIMIIAVGFSRIYLGVHYFSDVIGGFLMAVIYLVIFFNILDKIGVKYE